MTERGPQGVEGTALAATGLVVEFPGVRALDGAWFGVRPGEVHALMGENGAGKSTLIRVLAGLIRPREGRVFVGGAAALPGSVREAERLGISVVFQELDLAPTLTVEENVRLGRERSRLGFIGRDRGAARGALERVGLRVHPGRVLGDLPPATRQMVALARALDVGARVLILDEPTSSLDRGEVDRLFDVLRGLRAQGLAIVFVTHLLGQVEEITDRVTVLRNGATVGRWRTRDLGRSALIEAMTGRSIVESNAEPVTAPRARGRAVLGVRGVGRRGMLAPASLRGGEGECVGLAGLLGSGRTELARLIFGADAADSGVVRVRGRRVRRGSVRSAMKAGLAMTPEDRKGEGLFPDRSVRENILAAAQSRRGAWRSLPRAETARLVDGLIRALGIRCAGPGAAVRTLSGGNQQKVLLARWLATEPAALILDEPTRGIDVGARAEIDALIRSLRARGLAIVLISADLDELARVCDRALVLRDRAVIGTLAGPALSEAGVLAAIARGAGSP